MGPERQLFPDPAASRLVISTYRHLLLPVLLGACAAPVTQMGTVSQEEILAERSRQLQLALRNDLAMQQRLDDVAYPLLQSAALFCGQHARPRTGLRLANVAQYRADWSSAARALGYTDTLEVFHVPPGSAAERSGVRTGDRVLRIGAAAVPVGSPAAAAAASMIQESVRVAPEVRLIVQREGQPALPLTVAADTACAYDVVIERSGALNAYADGRRIVVTTAMLRFVPDDDELASVLAHEIAHNAMRHLDAQRRNATLGALFGAVVDLAAAANGYDTQGGFTKAGAEAGAAVFSQDFEREADYVGLYILALAGQPFDSVANLWRRMAVENPGSIRFASTHPTSAERFVRIEQWRRELRTKIAAGKPLIPESRNGRININPQIAATPRLRRSAPATQVAFTTPRDRTGLVGRVAPPEPERSEPRSTPPTAAEASKAAVAALTAAPTDSASGMIRPADPRYARVIIGAPASDSARVAAISVFEEGMRLVRRRDWKKARVSLERALRLDGSVAAYHAAMGDVRQALGELADAEASYSAALLIEAGNEHYRRRLDEIRRAREK